MEYWLHTVEPDMLKHSDSQRTLHKVRFVNSEKEFGSEGELDTSV